MLTTDGSPAGSITSSSDGTTLAACTPARPASTASAPGSARSAADATTSTPPAASVTTTSSTDASKLNEANCSPPTPRPPPPPRRPPARRGAAPRLDPDGLRHDRAQAESGLERLGDAAGAYLLFIHLAGDTISFPLIGALSDRFGISRAVLVLPTVALLGGLVVLLAVRTVGRDMARVTAP